MNRTDKHAFLYGFYILVGKTNYINIYRYYRVINTKG